MKLKIAVFASHGGSNLQAIIDACRNGVLDAQILAVISNNADSFALERARAAGIPAWHLSAASIPDGENLDERILKTLEAAGVNTIVLAGYMRRLGSALLARYRGRILNIHPALLPKYGGKGMYGERVHKAVLANGEEESGATVHLVDDEYDTGRILRQESVPVMPGDTAQSLAKRVLEVEHRLYVEVLGLIARGIIQL